MEYHARESTYAVSIPKIHFQYCTLAIMKITPPRKRMIADNFRVKVRMFRGALMDPEYVPEERFQPSPALNRYLALL